MLQERKLRARLLNLPRLFVVTSEQEQRVLVTPYKGLLQLEAIQLMKEGWGIKKPVTLTWSWTKFYYVFKIVLVKTESQAGIEAMQLELEQHLEHLANYNRC